MQTNFTLQQLADPNIANANNILRSCVHCGFCASTCPTYNLLGNELDSPRGRIYLIKDMLERYTETPKETVRHIDRCLSCFSCMTTCPSGVNYMQLIDHARNHIEKTFSRPLLDRLFRIFIMEVLTRPILFRIILNAASLIKPLAQHIPGSLGTMFKLAPSFVPPPSHSDRPQVFAAEGKRKGRVALMNGCAQQVLAPEINESTIRLLTRQGIEVIITEGSGCCGALVYHMGETEKGKNSAIRNIQAWTRELDGDGLDAIIINTSGCGTTVKNYGFMFREDKTLRGDASRISRITMDITEFLNSLNINHAKAPESLKIVYHSACSMQHGQQITNLPEELLSSAGFEVVTPNEQYMCCGSAGSYNLLQLKISEQLKARKIYNLSSQNPDVIALGNVGCLVQISNGTEIPAVHTVNLLDWALGGPKPKRLVNIA